MTIELIQETNKWRGTAAEMAAMDKAKITTGSAFYARDIKVDYEFENGDWQPVKVNVLGPLVKIGEDQFATFANSALINTPVNIDIAKPASLKSRYLLIFYNSSPDSDFNVKLRVKALAFGGGTRYPGLDSFTLPKLQTVKGSVDEGVCKLVEGMFIAMDLRVTMSNNSELPVAGGTAPYVRIYEAD